MYKFVLLIDGIQKFSISSACITALYGVDWVVVVLRKSMILNGEQVKLPKITVGCGLLL